jgi:hypothetical protein
MRTWLRRCSTLAGLSLAVVALTASPASAQKQASAGLLGGADFTTLTGLDSNASVRSSTGFAGGFYLNFPVAKSLLIEPEVLYTNKGAGIEDTEITLNLNYIEIPVLLRYEFTPDNPGPFAYIGPYVGFNVKCNTVVDTLPVPCADDDVQANTVVGGAIGAGFQRGRWGFDIRYEYDFGDAIKQDDGKNSALMVLIRAALN